MSQQPEFKRSLAKWQFSISQLLVAISLVAAICGAFRLDINFGVVALHLFIAVAITIVRTRAAIRCHQKLWDVLELPQWVRNNETTRLGFTSSVIALFSLFFFYLGIGSALVVLAIIFSFSVGGHPPRTNQVADFPTLFFAWFCMLVIPGTGLLFLFGWLKMTWPKSFFRHSATPSSPSAKTG